MTWYLARRLIGITVAEKLCDYEEEFFVVKADSLAAAKREARRLSKGEQEKPYKNVYGQDVAWKFQALIEVTQLRHRIFRDGAWLYRREFPGVSRVAQNSTDRLRVDTRTSLVGQEKAEWNGAMLLFRSRNKPIREEERLLLFRGDNHHAYSKALTLGREAANEWGIDLLGTFQVHDLFDKKIRSGTEVYWRFYNMGELKDPVRPPRKRDLTVPEFGGKRRRKPVAA